MNLNLYLVEQNASEHRQHLVDQAAHEHAAQHSEHSTARSQTMKRITRTILAALVALTLLGAGAQAAVAQNEQQVASLCCWVRR